MLEKFHHYSFCPQCRAPVLASHRFCTRCFLWLAKPQRNDLRAIDGAPGSFDVSWPTRVWIQLKVFQASLQYLIVGLGLGVLISLLTVYYAKALLPAWFVSWQPDVYRNSCYANMRSIQTSLEAYLLENKFTPALASDPVTVLHGAGFMRDLPHCPIAANRYKIPRHSSLQCVGSFAHGLPY